MLLLCKHVDSARSIVRVALYSISDLLVGTSSLTLHYGVDVDPQPFESIGIPKDALLM